RSKNQSLKAFVEVSAGDGCPDVLVGGSLELSHRHSDDATARLMGTFTDGFHYTGVAAGADVETSFNKQGAKPQGFFVLLRLGSAPRSPEDGNHLPADSIAHSIDSTL